jgi:O-antigen/teichoic acid export membrane protein
MTLFAKVRSSIFWTFLDTFVLRGLLFVAQLWMARILGPEVFGFMGIMIVFINLGNAISDTGMTTSLISSSDVNEKDYSTVFLTNLLISVFIYFLVFISAGYIANFYNQPLLENYIKLYSVSFVLSSFSIVQITIYTRELNFKTPAIINLIATVFGLSIGLILAYKNLGVLSIIYMYLSSQIISTILIFINSNWKPSFYLSKSKFQKHFHFGYKLLLSSIINVFFGNIYNIVIGKLFPLKVLGYYDRANAYNQYPISSLTSVISKVLYPLLAQIKNDKLKIKEVYKQIIQLSFFIIAPLMLFFSGVARPLFYIILGNEWLPSVVFFQILCFASILYPLQYYNVNVLNVFRRSDWFLKIEIIKKSILIFIVFISFKFGIYFFVSSSILVSLISYYINAYYTNKLIKYSFMEQLKDLAPIFLVSLLMFLFLLILQYKLSLDNALEHLIIASTCSMAYFIIINNYLKLKPYLLLLQQFQLLKKSLIGCRNGRNK